jgi:hypothetical protein
MINKMKDLFSMCGNAHSDKKNNAIISLQE